MVGSDCSLICCLRRLRTRRRSGSARRRGRFPSRRSRRASRVGRACATAGRARDGPRPPGRRASASAACAGPPGRVGCRAGSGSSPAASIPHAELRMLPVRRSVSRALHHLLGRQPFGNRERVLHHLVADDRIDHVVHAGVLLERVFARLQLGARLHGNYGAKERPAIVVDHSLALQDIGDVADAGSRGDIDDPSPGAAPAPRSSACRKPRYRQNRASRPGRS